MTNVGIRKYEKYLTQNLNDLVTGMININPDNSNLHFTIPLFSTISNCKMDFSLNYSYLSKYEKDGFGKGFKLSYYLKLYKENETMKMKLNDSSIIELTYDSERGVYVNELYGYTAQLESLNTYYHVYDKFGNYYYMALGLSYPIKIAYLNGNCVKSGFEEDKLVFTNDFDDKVILTNSESANYYVTNIEYIAKINDISETVYTINIEYSSNLIINKIEKIYNNTIINTILMEHHSYLIEIKDGIKTNSIRYSMNSDGRVYKIEEGFNGTYENMRYTNITYDLLIPKTTIVSDYLGNYQYYIFNTEGLLDYTYDENLIANKYKYDSDKNIIFEAKNIPPATIDNKVVNGTFTDGLNGWNYSSEFVITDCVIGSKSYKEVCITEGENIYQSINIDCDVKNYIGVSYYLKNGGVGSIRVNIVGYDGASNKIFDETYTYQGGYGYQYDVKNIGYLDGVNRIVVKFIGVENNFYLTNVGVRLNPDIKLYTYDKCNLYIIDDGIYKTKYHYDEKNLLSQIVGEDNTYKQVLIDKGRNLNLYNQDGIYSYDKYDNSGNVIESSLVVNDITYKNEYTYDGSNNLTASKDIYGKETSYEVNNITKQIISEEYPNEMKIDYTYNDDLSLKKINYNDGNSNNYNLYNYDARKNITSIKTLSRERVEYRYNSLDNLSSVYNNDNLITRYEYENEDSEGIYTGRIYKEVVGNILYEYAYDKRGNITSRKKNYVNSESYEYDDYDRIINIKNNNNEVVYSYEYGDDYIKETYNEDISHNITYSKNNKIYENENYKKIMSIYDNRGDLVNNIKAKYYQIGYALFFDEYIAVDSEVKKSSRLTGENKYIEASTLELPIDIVMEENISCANISNDTSILQYSYDNSNTDITLQFYYKMSSSTSGTILKILYDSVNNVELKIVNQKLRIIYNTYYIEILDTEIILDKWNLITYHIKIEENANSFTITNEVGLNKEYKTLQTTVTNFLKEGTYQINIGGYSDSKCIGYYTGIVINNNSDIISSINEYINLANRYLFKERNKRVVLYNEFDKEIYPLCNNFSSINGKKAFIIKGYSDEQFIYDKDLKRNVYHINGSTLAYLFNGINYQVCAKIKMLENGGNDIIYYMPGSKTYTIKRNEENKLVVNDEVVDVIINDNIWYEIGLIVTPDSNPNKLIVNDTIYTLTETQTTYGYFNFYIGKYNDYVSNMCVCDITYTSNTTNNTNYEKYGMEYKYNNLNLLTDIIINGNTDYHVCNIEYENGLLPTKTTYKNDRYTYTYDNMQNLTYILKNGNTIWHGKYDKYNQLTEEVIDQETYIYEYDSFGNIINNNGKLCQYENEFKDQLTKVGEDIVSYDTNNNIISYGNYRFEYEGRRLTKYQDIGSNREITYTYNNKNLRKTKTENTLTTHFVYEGTKLIYEYNDNVSHYFIYDEEKIIGYETNISGEFKTYYYVYDIKGNIIEVIDELGNTKASYSYNAWGKILSQSGELANDNPIRYKGYYYDVETGLFWLSSRYYSPELCRFISPDDVDYLDPESINGLNLYAYCQNDPINYYDPTGHFMISTAVLIGAIIGAVVGAGVGFGIAAYNDYKDDGQIFNGSVAWYDYLGATLLGGTIGAVVGGAIGYGIGYLAGGTYSNGLVAKSVTKGVKSFMSNTNNINHVLGKAKHNLSGYTAKSMGKLMKKTLAKGTYEAYKTVNSMVLASTNSQVTYVIINGVIKIGDMWIKSGG